MNTPKRATNGARAKNDNFSCGVIYKRETGVCAVFVSICESRKASDGQCVRFLAV